LQEYNLPLKETLTKGLRPYSQHGRGFNFLTQCKFLKPREWGLRPCADVSDPFATTKFSTWPFAQMLRGKAVTLLAEATSLKVVTEASPNWTVGDAVTTYDLNDPASTKSITGSDVWHMADFYDSWMLFNGTSVVVKTNKEGMFGETNNVFVQNAIAIQTGCDFPGRAIMGGFSPASYFSTSWDAIWDDWLLHAPFTLDMTLDDVDTNFVMWTTIGGGDLLNLFLPDMAVDGVIKEDKRTTRDGMFLELWRRNEAGFMPMPWQGTVLVVKPLGNGVMVYGDDGIAFMPHVTDPYPTFGLRKLGAFGIGGRGCVGGDNSTHIFLDTAGVLWRISSENYSLQKLGYEEVFDGLVDQKVVISYNQRDNEYIISGEDSSNNALSYVLTPTGLGQSPQQVTSAYTVEGALLGVFSTDASTIPIAVTDVLDFGYRDLKTITTVELGIEVTTDATTHVAVDYRYNKDDSWTRSTWVLVNDMGFARIQATANEFRVAVKCSKYADMKLDYINVKWQSSGRRTVRGLHAGEAYK